MKIIHLKSAYRVLATVNVVGLLLVAAWFRCRSLGHIPGLNGDEAWYGLRSLELLGGQTSCWQTPTGNPLNPFFFGPMVLLHACFGPSIALLRWVAAASGLAALALNWLLCRWVFDRRTAAVSTVVLAILPINIAYSRFAWDASQSLAATLPVLYFSLAAIRFSRRQGWWIAAAVAAAAVAVLVHPTNLFIAAGPAAAIAARVHWQDLQRAAAGIEFRGRGAALALSAIVLAAAGAIAAGCWLWSGAHALVASRLLGLEQLLHGQALPQFSLLYARLFTGGTAYRFLAGSRSWFQWPSETGEGWGIDVALFWIAVAAALWMLRRWWKTDGRAEDRVLVAAFALELVAFLLVAGPPALAPDYQRYALCLIAPGVLLLSRGGALAMAAAPRRGQFGLAAAALGGWLILADYQAHYFDFIERTGGCAQATFRTAAVEPKLAALRFVEQHRGPGAARIVTSQYWNELPLRYLAWGDNNVVVNAPEEVEDSAGLSAAMSEGRVWLVEFADSDALTQARRRLENRKVHQWQVKDYGGEPVLTVLHVLPQQGSAEP